METDGIVSRTVALLILLIGTFVSGTIPIYIVRRLRRNATQVNPKAKSRIAGNLITSFMMCFGGGVLFATCFIHLLPDVRESFEQSEKEGNETEHDSGQDEHTHEHSHGFPLPEFLVCAGFFAVYFIEEVLHAALGHVHGPKEGPEMHGHSHSPAVLTCYNRENEQLETMPDSIRKRPASGSQLSTTTLTSVKNELSYGSTDNTRNTTKDPTNGEIVLNPSEFTTTSSHRLIVTPLPTNGNGGHHHSHGLGKGGDKVQLSFGGLLIVVALSFHSIFEGLAIGLQQTARDVWTTFAAVAIHKFVISFVVGLEVYGEGTRALVVVSYMVIFAVMSPIGIIIGMVSQIALAGTLNVAIGCLNALATGTLLYVTFFEVLQREKNSQLSGLLQFLAVVLGFSIMTVINVFA